MRSTYMVITRNSLIVEIEMEMDWDGHIFDGQMRIYDVLNKQFGDWQEIDAPQISNYFQDARAAFLKPEKPGMIRVNNPLKKKQ